MIIYLMRDSILSLSKVFEYGYDNPVMAWTIVEKLGKKLRECNMEDRDWEAVEKVQRLNLMSENGRLEWNVENPGRAVKRTNDAGILTRELLQQMDQKFLDLLNKQLLLPHAGTDHAKWNKSMNTYVDAVAKLLHKSYIDRPAGEEGSTTREIHRAASSMFRIVYAQLEGKPRALPVLTPAWQSKIVLILREYGLSFAEVSFSQISVVFDPGRTTRYYQHIHRHSLFRSLACWTPLRTSLSFRPATPAPPTTRMHTEIPTPTSRSSPSSSASMQRQTPRASTSISWRPTSFLWCALWFMSLTFSTHSIYLVLEEPVISLGLWHRKASRRSRRSSIPPLHRP